jgi:uncharacterized repeat protein (TIGR03803 family)
MKTTRLCLTLIVLLSCVQVGAQTFTVLHSFNDINSGYNPRSDLILSGSTLYGTTYWGGGSSANGIIFKLNTDGTGYTVLKNFGALVNNTNSDGANPQAGLIVSGSALYGTTYHGGISSNGVVFKVNTDGTGYSVLKNFSSFVNGTNSDGANPSGVLLLYGSTIFGTTYCGGISNRGTLFAINTNGTGFTNLHNFKGYPSDGANPFAGLIISGNTLYGTTSGGGSSGNGTIFKVNIDGTGYSVLKNFTNYPSGAAFPHAGLTLSGNTLYGTTQFGGNSDLNSSFGTVFKVNTDGTGYIVLNNFTNDYQAKYPKAGVIFSNNALYGTTEDGGYSFDGGESFV